MVEVGNRSRRWAPWVSSSVVGALGFGLVAALPHFVGATWPAIGRDLATVPVIVLVGLAGLWFLGLLVHVPVLLAAMPGLGVRQALALNLSGSAVSNVLPVGGPAGMGLGYAMARSWGFPSDRFASYTVATNLWNAVGKFVVSMLILATAAVLGVGLPSGLGAAVLGATAFISVIAVASGATFRTEAATAAAGRRLDVLRKRVRRSAEPDAFRTWLVGSRRELVTTVRSGWTRMTLGVLFYLLLQALLLHACLGAVGARAGFTVVAVAFAIERLISLAPITPGAAGVAELGTVAALHSFGVDPVTAAAGVLLYRTLMFAVEIPVGGAIALVWFLRKSRLPVPEWPALPEPAVPTGRVVTDVVA
ncbi:MAG: lysylphosphatidylglycerol synthase domain-containing protein [Marmoricola sp.]